MSSVFLLFPILFPIISGVLMLAFPVKSDKLRNVITFIISLINLSAVLYITFEMKAASFNVLKITDVYKLVLKVDDFGRYFSCLVSVLWPFSLLYAYEYMEHEERKNTFFSFFMMSLGAVLGIAYTSDLFSMYVFYELLTFATFPLVMHVMSKEAMLAGRKYLTYMLGGAAFSLVGMVVLQKLTGTLDFRLGGIMGGVERDNYIIFLFVIMFCGLAVKAALMPFGKWLVTAAVAPTPVTALLHAVAVVKAGAFACIRLIYFIFGADYMSGTWGQQVILILTIITVFYGSFMAVKEPHIKRRLAYSTISNLSYILFAAALMSQAGMTAAIMHLTAHAVTKIGLFFCVGSVMHVTGKTLISEIDGLGKKMRWIFLCFTISALSLIGIPQFVGFVSKFRIIDASLEAGSVLAYIGGFTIIVSALFTAVYLLSVCIKAYFPVGGKVCDNYEQAHDPGALMLIPIVFSAIATIVIGFWWQPVMELITNIVTGGIL